MRDLITYLDGPYSHPNNTYTRDVENLLKFKTAEIISDIERYIKNDLQVSERTVKRYNACKEHQEGVNDIYMGRTNIGLNKISHAFNEITNTEISDDYTIKQFTEMVKDIIYNRTATNVSAQESEYKIVRNILLQYFDYARIYQLINPFNICEIQQQTQMYPYYYNQISYQ